MNALRRLLVHIVLLFAAAGFAYVQSRPDDPLDVPLKPGEVDLWGGKPEDVTRVELTDERQVVTVERKTDDTGDYFAGRVAPVDAPAPDAASSATAAASSSASASAAPPPSPPPPRPVKPARFVSVKVASTVMEKLAPLRAKRSIGDVAPDQAAAFGLEDPAGRLVIDVAGVKHAFALGSPTPGAANRYVRYEKDNRVYVIDASVVRDLQGGAGRLAERQQHAWKMAEVDAITVTGGEGTSPRELIRSGPEGRRFWADASAPETNDETAGNWLGKVQRLRPVTYREQLPAGAARVVRVAYRGEGGKQLGFLELHRADDGEAPTFFIVTEHTREPTEVATATAEQVRDDLASLLGGATGDGEEPETTSSSVAPTATASPAAPVPSATRP
ncbi:MAG: DUF4340 domain-containing protein [Myxococcota bacterium]